MPDTWRPAPTACRHPVSGTVSPRSSRCFSPFPHGTGSLSVTEEYLGLEGGPPAFRQGCSCPALLEDCSSGFPYGAVTRCGPPFQTLPVPKTAATGLVRVRSPLLAESRLMSFPPATEMFQFAGFASWPYGLRPGYPGTGPGWVAPFGDPGIADRAHLPRAFRSVLRPSSPLSAKASTRCPCFTLRHAQRQEPRCGPRVAPQRGRSQRAPAPDRVRDQLRPEARSAADTSLPATPLTAAPPHEDTLCGIRCRPAAGAAALPAQSRPRPATPRVVGATTVTQLASIRCAINNAGAPRNGGRRQSRICCRVRTGPRPLSDARFPVAVLRSLPDIPAGHIATGRDRGGRRPECR